MGYNIKHGPQCNHWKFSPTVAYSVVLLVELSLDICTFIVHFPKGDISAGSEIFLLF